MADKRDYYEVLGVPKTATEAEIKSAFRKQAKTCHPDLHPGDKEAEARFKELNEAAEVLCDADKRAKYDQFGHAAFDPSMGGIRLREALAASAFPISSIRCLAAASAVRRELRTGRLREMTFATV